MYRPLILSSHSACQFWKASFGNNFSAYSENRMNRWSIRLWIFLHAYQRVFFTEVRSEINWFRTLDLSFEIGDVTSEQLLMNLITVICIFISVTVPWWFTLTMTYYYRIPRKMIWKWFNSVGHFLCKFI